MTAKLKCSEAFWLSAYILPSILLTDMVSSMVAQFVGLCEATGSFLGTVSEPDIAAQHAKNISAHLDRFKGRAEVFQPAMLQAVRNLPIAIELKNELIRKVATLATGADVAHRSFQDWSAWPGYITQESAAEWQGAMCSQERLRRVVMLPFQCGLRQPSEPTFQALTAVYLMMESKEELSPLEKKRALDLVKTCYRNLGATPYHGRFVGTLPKSPEEFRALCPVTFKMHFGESPNFINIDPSVWTLSKCFSLTLNCWTCFLRQEPFSWSGFFFRIG